MKPLSMTLLLWFEGEALLVVCGPSGCLRELLQELLERASKVREVGEFNPLDVTREEM